MVTAQPRLPPSQRPCIAYSEEDYSCFPYHEFDPKHPILGEHYESAHEVTLFFKNLSPYEYEVAKAVKDNLLKKCIWTPSYLVYENRRIMYSARLLAITTHLNYESFEFYKYTYDYTTNTATIIAPVFKSNPSKSDEVSSIQSTLAPIDFTAKSHTLVGKPVKSDYIQSDLYEDKWLADLEKYFSDKKAAAAKEAEKKAKLLAEAKAAAEKKVTPIPTPVSKTSFVTPLSKPSPALGTSSSTLPLSTDESSAKKRPLTTAEESPLKAPSVFGQSSFFQQSQTSTFSQSSSSKNKRQLSDTEDEEPRFNSSKKHTIIEDEDIITDSETDKQPKPFTFSFTKPVESSKPASDIKADEQPKSTPSFFGFGKTSQPTVSSSNPDTAPAFSFDFGKGSSTTTKKPSPYQASSTFFSKPDLKTVSDNDEEKESHLEKTELHNIPIVPFGGATTLPKPSFSFGSNADTPAFGKFNTLNTSSKPDVPKTAENEQTEKVETSTASDKPLEEKPATTTFSGFSFGQKPTSLPDKTKETEAQSTQADTSSTDAKPEEIKPISVPSVLVTGSESSDKEKPKPASPFGSFFTPKTTTLPEADSDEVKSDSTPKATAIPTFSFGTSLTKTTNADSTPISATQATSIPFAQTTTPLVPLKPSEPSAQDSTAINIDSKPTNQLPAPSPGSPMSITPLQATPEKGDSMQISPPRAPNSPLSTFKQAVNPFQTSTTSTALGSSATFKPQTSQFPKFATNPFANPNPNPQPTSAPLSTNKFPTTKFNARPRPNVQPLGSTNASVDPFASSSFSPTSNTSFNNSFGSSNAPNPFGSTNSFAANNNSNVSNTFNSANSFATNTNNNASNPFGSTNSFGTNNTNNASNSFGSNNSFGSANSFGANNNSSISNSFGASNSFGTNTNNNASNSFGSANNFGSSGFGNNTSNSFGSNNSFGANNNSNSPNPFSATNSFNSNNNSAPNSFGSTNNFGQSGFGSNNNAFGSTNNFGSPSFQSGAGHFEENGTPNALPNHLNMNQNPGFSSRTNSINSGGFSSGPNSVTSRDGSPSSSNSHMAGRVIAQPKSRRRN